MEPLTRSFSMLSLSMRVGPMSRAASKLLTSCATRPADFGAVCSGSLCFCTFFSCLLVELLSKKWPFCLVCTGFFIFWEMVCACNRRCRAGLASNPGGGHTRVSSTSAGKLGHSVLVFVTVAALLKGRALSPVLKKAWLPSLNFRGDTTVALLAWRVSRADMVIAVHRSAVQIIWSEE